MDVLYSTAVFNGGVADEFNPPGGEIVVAAVAGVQLSLRALPGLRLQAE